MSVCKYCEREHPEDQVANPHYCVARLIEANDNMQAECNSLKADLEFNSKMLAEKNDLYAEASGRVERLEAENAKLREALEQLADDKGSAYWTSN